MTERVPKLEREIAELATIVKNITERFAEMTEENHQMRTRQDKMLFGEGNEDIGLRGDVIVLKKDLATRQKYMALFWTTLFGSVITIVVNVWKRISE